jgi:hypothetical protein
MDADGVAAGLGKPSVLRASEPGVDEKRFDELVEALCAPAIACSIQSFVRVALDETVPDHSTISRTRRLIDVETHQAVFQWVLEVLAERNRLKGNTIGVDATTLEANVALRSIVRRDTGEWNPDAHAGTVGQTEPEAEEEGVPRRMAASA